ncbi:unnamed protein product [Prorocentrum cordatum]|uniref:Uncharacterized protein n=1 Tax=Prorocentrum cordatum TaxID=2364126 RepID=A0ABN9SUY1_9DINO|nr:unnamed protein product [Polarella glacialis]
MPLPLPRRNRARVASRSWSERSLGGVWGGAASAPLVQPPEPRSAAPRGPADSARADPSGTAWPGDADLREGAILRWSLCLPSPHRLLSARLKHLDYLSDFLSDGRQFFIA